MNITRAESVATKRGPAEYFTGTVWMDEIAPPQNRRHLRALRVSFEPRARTAWHTHPHGQVLHIVAGIARVQCAGGAVVDVHPGDSVWFEPGERHWHGAGPNSLMVHVAIQESDDTGNSATWFEHVTDAEYERS